MSSFLNTACVASPLTLCTESGRTRCSIIIDESSPAESSPGGVSGTGSDASEACGEGRTWSEVSETAGVKGTDFSRTGDLGSSKVLGSTWIGLSCSAFG